jgi:hydroxypyruvate isomerase
MIFSELPIIERVRRIDDLGFQAGIWDWAKHDIDRCGRRGKVLFDGLGFR